MSRSKLLGAVFALPLMFACATSAQANVIGLTIDGSGSISSADWILQKQGYVTALNSLYGGPVNYYGLNSIGVWKFDNTVTHVFGIQTINNAADLLALTTAISAMTQPGGNTAIGASIATATAAISAFGGSNCSLVNNVSNCLIDVSTDGVNNSGVDPTVATAAANAAGVKVNCLSVGGNSGCGWNLAGLDFNATSFAQFTAAITQKLSQELTKAPEPLTLSLFGAGLVGAAALRRRKNKTA